MATEGVVGALDEQVAELEAQRAARIKAANEEREALWKSKRAASQAEEYPPDEEAEGDDIPF